jgi:hypothetical protein
MDAHHFDFATADNTDDGIVFVLFDGPDREVVAIVKGSRAAAQTLRKALGSALSIETSWARDG